MSRAKTQTWSSQHGPASRSITELWSGGISSRSSRKPDCPTYGCTICAIRVPRSYSHVANSRRSLENGSGTQVQHSPWTPTLTFSPICRNKPPSGLRKLSSHSEEVFPANQSGDSARGPLPRTGVCVSFHTYKRNAPTNHQYASPAVRRAIRRIKRRRRTVPPTQ